MARKRYTQAHMHTHSPATAPDALRAMVKPAFCMKSTSTRELKACEMISSRVKAAEVRKRQAEKTLMEHMISRKMKNLSGKGTTREYRHTVMGRVGGTGGEILWVGGWVGGDTRDTAFVCGGGRHKGTQLGGGGGSTVQRNFLHLCEIRQHDLRGA